MSWLTPLALGREHALVGSQTIFFGGGGEKKKKKTTKNVANIVAQLAVLSLELLRSSRLAERAFKMSASARRHERFLNKLLVKEKML